MTTIRDQSLHDELLEEMFTETDDLPEADEPVAEQSAEETVEQQATTEDESFADSETATEPTDDEPSESDRFTTERAALERAIAGARHLPAAVRKHLTEAIEHATWSDTGEEQPTLTVSETARWLEQSLPGQFALNAEQIESREHPYGESFFSGNATGVDDRTASEIAAEQLAATGFARKQ